MGGVTCAPTDPTKIKKKKLDLLLHLHAIDIHATHFNRLVQVCVELDLDIVDALWCSRSRA